ncbi:MAG: hypothetical protein ABI239_08980 [Aquihabitans sp.]
MAHPTNDPADFSGPGVKAGDLGSHGETGLRAQLPMLIELMEADPNELTSGERVDAVRALAALSGQVDAALSRHAAGFDAHMDYVDDGARTAFGWMGARTEIPTGTAKAVVTRGRALRSCPILEDAYRCGVIGTAKVRDALAAREGVEALFAEQEQVVVSIIAGLTVLGAHKYLDKWRATALATIGADDDKAPADVAANSLHLSRTFEKRWAINGDLDVTGGAELEGMLAAEITAKFASGEYRADDGLLLSQRKAQALMALCRRGALASTVAGELRPSVSIFIDLASLLGLPVRDPRELLQRRCQLADGTVVPLSKVLELSADATLNAVLGVFGIEGKFHPVGEIRDTRSANARQRRALAVRDQGCIFTGCDRPAAWSQAHHVDTWHATHQTTVPRLALLCSFHHHRIHDHGYTLETDLDGTPTIRRPDGTLLPSPPPGHKIPPDPPPGAGAGPPRANLFGANSPPEVAGSNRPPPEWTYSDQHPAHTGPELAGPAASSSGSCPGNGPGRRASGARPSQAGMPTRKPSRFQPLARKRSRTQLQADLYFEQAGQMVAVILDRNKG